MTTTSSAGTRTATKVALIAAGVLAGGILATAAAASAASPTPTPTAGSSSSTATDPHPGDNGADGVPESQEQHGPGQGGHGHGGGRGPSLSGTVTAVGSDTVSIKTPSGTTTYTVASSSDIDKNGEASLSSLVVGDAVTFSVDATKTTQIDKLHAGDEAKDMPQRPADGTRSSTPNATESSTT